MNFCPLSQPKAARENILARLTHVPAGVFVVGIRGYYHENEENERGIYDDALFIITPDSFSSYNANVDPGIFRTGIATLAAGTWLYRKGTHGLSKPKAAQYQAYVQAGPVTVTRDNERPETGFFGINIHRGGINSVSSLGCQTIPASQWEKFRQTLNTSLLKNKQDVFEYILLK